MGYEKPTYCLMLRGRGKNQSILYSVGDLSDATTIIRFGGKNVGRIFNDIVSALSSQGAIMPIKVIDDEKVYSVREDLGPIIGAYLILIHRSRNVEKWSNFLRALLEERYPGVAKALVLFLEVAIELSKSFGRAKTSRGGKDYTIPSEVLSALSTTLKVFVSRILTRLKSDLTD